MVKPRIMVHAAVLAALAAAALALNVSGSFAGSGSRVDCTGTRPEYGPGDLRYKQAQYSASARLALAIQWREYFASCRRVAAPHRHHNS